MVMYETGKLALANEELKLDKPDELAFCAQFGKLARAPVGTVRLFDRKDYYTAHGPDALFIAKAYYRTNSVLKYLGSKNGDQGLPSCTLSMANAKQFMRDALTAKQLRIEIWAKEGSKGSWKMDKQASPGNFQDLEGFIFAHTDILTAPIVAAISISSKASVTTVGIAFADASMREIGITEFVDNEILSNVESFIIQLGVKEMLIPAAAEKKDKDVAKADPEASKLKVLVDRCGVVITERKKNEFRTTSIEQDLAYLLKGSSKIALEPQKELKEAMSACAALVSYLDLIADESNKDAYTLLSHDLAQFMRLDASAVRALHLMPDPNGLGGAGKNMSLFGVLNKCKTAQGTRMLAQWLKQPLVNKHEIERRQSLVECFVDDSFIRQSLQDDHLKTVPDLTRMVKKFGKGNANLQDVARVYQAVQRLSSILELLRNAGAESTDTKQHKLIQQEYVAPLTDLEVKLAPYSDMVETTLDLEELEHNNYVIKAEFSDELQIIKVEMDRLHEEMDEEVERVASDLGFDNDGKTLHFEKNTQHGHVFRLTRKEAKAIDKGKLKYQTLGTKNNGTTFTTKTLKNVVAEFQEYQQKYDRKQSTLVKEVVAIAASYCEVLLPLNTQLAHLDVVVSLAHVAVHSPTAYVKPVLTNMGEGNLELTEARHPCLELQDDINFISNDIELKRGVSEFNIITGPNMGGKSTFIRQVGVIALMAQIGSFVPCTEAKLPIFDSILARVGAGDFQLKGVSTFMAEMLETASILKSATRNSLIIIDELGRGTSTYDGFGLAWSISEHIAAEIGSFCLFATHFHELCSLADQIPHVTNLHVLAQVEAKEDSLTGRDITLLYKVEPGSCDQSFGISVAELAQFPPEVLDLARRKANDLEAAEGLAPEIATCSPEEVAAGAAILRNMLVEWANLPEDEDVDMTASSEDQREREIAKLRECFDKHREEFSKNSWASALLA